MPPIIISKNNIKINRKFQGLLPAFSFSVVMLLLAVVQKKAVGRKNGCGKGFEYILEAAGLKKVFFYIVTYFLIFVKAYKHAGAGICIPGFGRRFVKLLDSYENLHMRAWVQDSAALAGSRAVDII